MAPESERASCNVQPNHMLKNFPTSCNLGTKDCILFHVGDIPNEPTLTCSEVVERLPAKEFLKLKRDQWADLTGYKFAGEPTIDNDACQFAEAYATAILHSWRERRVQELEEALEHLVVLIGTKSTFTKTDRQVVELAVRAHGGIRNIFKEEV